MADTAPRILHVPGPARDKVQVAVKDSLPCGTTHICTDIEPRDRWVALEHKVAHLTQEAIASQQLILCDLEVVRHMSPWNDECVKIGNRKGVPSRVGPVIPKENPGIIRCRTPGRDPPQTPRQAHPPPPPKPHHARLGATRRASPALGRRQSPSDQPLDQ